MDNEGMTESQLNGVSITERACSVFSLLGSVLVIVTFCTSKSFHKPINRLVFYASFGNMMTNVATLMARSYIDDALSPGCQFQAFLIQMFMPADAFWTLAMAVNVYLTFYYKFDVQKLRRMEVPYLLGCYGIPFVVALAYVFVRDDRRGRMYGNATLWCWVSPSWDIWRIATFYGPVWVVILVTFFIYIRAGREIYKKHKQLRDFRYSSHAEPDPLPPSDDPYAAASKTTEVFVTTEIVNSADDPPAARSVDDIDLAPLGRRSSTAAKSKGTAVYSVTISATPGDGGLSLPIQGGPEGRAATVTAETAAAVSGTRSVPASAAGTQRQRRRAAYEANSAAWSYAKCALLFFTAMLVTWIPSSANRVFSVVHVNAVSVPLEYMSAFVLPLQGFWNAIIYVTTSWKACTALWDDMASRLWRRQPIPAQNELHNHHHHHHHHLHHLHHHHLHRSEGMSSDEMLDHMVGGHGSSSGGGGGGGGGANGSGRSKLEKNYESESVKELAVSQTTSRER